MTGIVLGQTYMFSTCKELRAQWEIQINKQSAYNNQKSGTPCEYVGGVPHIVSEGDFKELPKSSNIVILLSESSYPLEKEKNISARWNSMSQAQKPDRPRNTQEVAKSPGILAVPWRSYLCKKRIEIVMLPKNTLDWQSNCSTRESGQGQQTLAPAASSQSSHCLPHQTVVVAATAEGYEIHYPPGALGGLDHQDRGNMEDGSSTVHP